MKLSAIEKSIERLEQSADTVENVRELADLYIVREHLKKEKTD